MKKIPTTRLVGDSTPIEKIQRGVEVPLHGLIQYFTKNTLTPDAGAFWDTMQWVLSEGIPMIRDDEWGKIKYGCHPWDEMVIRDKAHFIELFIDPVLAKGKEVIATYDQSARSTFDECSRKAVELKADAIKVDPQTGGERLVSKYAPDTPRQVSEETLEKARYAKARRAMGVTLKGISYELGCSKAYASKLIKLASNPDPTPAPPKPLRPTKRGSNPEYLLARLKRDKPDLAAQVESGDLALKEAVRAAGFLKSQQLTLSKKTDPVELAKKIMDFDPELAVSVAIEIQNLHTERA